MHSGWRWWVLAALGTVVLAHCLTRSRAGMSADEAADYARELGRMQDA